MSRRRNGPRLPRVVTIWYGAVATAGFAFGLIGDRRPLGDDIFVHPFALFAFAVGAGLLALRIATRCPVPQIIADRALMLGGALGLAAFLAGNFVAAHLIGR